MITLPEKPSSIGYLEIKEEQKGAVLLFIVLVDGGNKHKPMSYPFNPSYFDEL